MGTDGEEKLLNICQLTELEALIEHTADKKPTSSIQHDQSYQVTETMAPQFQSSFRQKKRSHARSRGTNLTAKV